jgi:hypothetical protein
VRETVQSNPTGDVKYFACDCRDFFSHRWCLQSAFMQHRKKLRLLGKTIPKSRRLGSKLRKSFRIAKALDAAAVKCKRKELEEQQGHAKKFGKK